MLRHADEVERALRYGAYRVDRGQRFIVDGGQIKPLEDGFLTCFQAGLDQRVTIAHRFFESARFKAVAAADGWNKTRARFGKHKIRTRRQVIHRFRRLLFGASGVYLCQLLRPHDDTAVELIQPENKRRANRYADEGEE